MGKDESRPLLNCPNCGAPVTDEICAYCGSRVLPKTKTAVLTVQLFADNVCVEELLQIVDRPMRSRGIEHR